MTNELNAPESAIEALIQTLPALGTSLARAL
jgi:hypothetical protein